MAYLSYLYERCITMLNVNGHILAQLDEFFQSVDHHTKSDRTRIQRLTCEDIEKNNNCWFNADEANVIDHLIIRFNNILIEDDDSREDTFSFKLKHFLDNGVFI